MIALERWLSDFKKIAIMDELHSELLEGNAARLLGPN